MRIAKGIELLQKDTFEPGFLGQLPPGGFLDGLAHPGKTARKGPAALKRHIIPLDQQDLEVFVIQSKDDTIRSYRGSWMCVRIFHRHLTLCIFYTKVSV